VSENKKRVENAIDFFKVYREVTFDSSIVSVTDQSGTIIVANDNFCKISGYSEKELIGQNHRIVNSGYHPKTFFEEMWNTLTSGKKWQGEICNRNKDGQIYWVDTTITPVFNKEKEEYEFISIRLEVTHRVRFEEVSNKIQSIANIGYWEWRVGSDALFWSSQVYEIHGLNPDTYSPTLEKGINHYAPEFQELISAAVTNAIEKGIGWDLELQLINSQQKRVWVRAVGNVEMVEGKAFRVFGTFQDIDKRKSTRLELAKSQMQLKLAVEAAGICSWVYIASEDKLTWDDAAYDIFGIEPSKKQASFREWLEYISLEYREKAHGEFIRAIKSHKEMYDDEYQIDHPKKGKRFIKGRALISYNSDGSPGEIIGLNWDITKEKEVEVTLVAAREKAIETTQAKSAFLASMSHEIRTPMNGLMGTLELLEETKLDREQSELLDTIQMSGEQLLNVVNDILDFSKIEAGKLDLEYRSFDLNRLLKGVKAIFEVQAAKKDIALEIKIDPSVPRYIMGDDTRLKQVLTNLVSNALKFTQKGSVTIKVERDQKSVESENIFTLDFHVQDTGIGIPQDKQQKLFDSFSQVDESTTRKYGGTGLGLAICKSLVGSMGGSIEVSSIEGKGSNFSFSIMTQEGESTTEEKIASEVISFRNDLRILLAEDNLTNQKLALSFLKKIGFKADSIVIANNGLEAYRKVGEYIKKDEPFDVVLMDMQMPEMDGVEAARIINDVHKEKAPLIFAMTANVFEEDRKRCMEAGMAAFATKPIKKNILIKLFNEFFHDESIRIDEIKRESKMSEEKNYNYLNDEKILFEFGEDFDIFEELVEDYRSQVPVFVETIQNGVANGDTKAIQVAGHTIKGIVGNFYCDKLKDAAFAIEEAGKNGEVDSVEEKLGIFMSVNKLVDNELVDFLKENAFRSEAA
jgi:PAS domain S-box-containing protein